MDLCNSYVIVSMKKEGCFEVAASQGGVEAPLVISEPLIEG